MIAVLGTALGFRHPQPYALQVIPASYDVFYGVQDNGPNWPDNTNHRLGAIAILIGGPFSIDVPVIDLRIGVTLNGAPLSSANTGDFDEGNLWLVDPSTQEVISLGDTWNDGTDRPVPPYVMRLVPGRYDAHYAIQDNGPRWPDNTDHLLVCAALE